MDTLTFEDFMGKLKAFEVGVQIIEGEMPKAIEEKLEPLKPNVEKSIAFKTSQSDEVK